MWVGVFTYYDKLKMSKMSLIFYVESIVIVTVVNMKVEIPRDKKSRQTCSNREENSVIKPSIDVSGAYVYIY